MFTAFVGTKWPGKLDAEPDWYDGGIPGLFYDEEHTSRLASCTLTIKADGTFSIVNLNLGVVSFGSVDWLVPANSHCARHWWVRFTVNSTTGIGSHTASTSWLQLSSDRAVVVSANNGDSDGGNEKFVNYQIEFAPSAGGSPIAQTTTVQMYAYSLSS